MNNNSQPDQTNYHKDSYSPFRQVFLITGIFFFIFISRLILAPFLPNIEKECSVSHAEAASLFLFLSLGMGISQVFSGFIAQKIMHRNTVISAITGAAVGWIIMSIVTSFLWMKVLMFFIGSAIGIYLPSGLSTITSILAKKDWGKGMAIHELAPNSSYILAPGIAALVGAYISWRVVVLGVGLLALTMSIVYTISGKGGLFAGESPRPEVLKKVLKQPQFWILALLFSLAISMTIGIYSMIPVYLINEHGFTQAWANNLLSISRVPCLLIVIFAGFIIDRIGANHTIVIAMGFTGLFTVVLGLVTGIPLIWAVLIQPLFGACFYPAGFTVISMVFNEHIRNVAISLIVPMATVFGTGFVPTLIGWFGDQGHFPIGFVIVGSLIFAGVSSVYFLKIEYPLNDY